MPGVENIRTEGTSRLDVPRRHPVRCARERMAELPPLSESAVAALLAGSAQTPAFALSSNLTAAREIFRWVPGLSTVSGGDETAREGEIELDTSLRKAIAALWGLDDCLTGIASERRLQAALEAVRGFHENFGSDRTRILVVGKPSAAWEREILRAGYEPLSLESLSAAAVSAALEAESFAIAALVAALPNLAGDFSDVAVFADCAELVHSRGAQVVIEGSELKALHGVALPRDLGADVVAVDLASLLEFSHEGTGTGAVAVRSHLAPFLPVPSEVWPQMRDTASAATALALLFAEGAHGLRRSAEDRALASRARAAGVPLPASLAAAFPAGPLSSGPFAGGEAR